MSCPRCRSGRWCSPGWCATPTVARCRSRLVTSSTPSSRWTPTAAMRCGGPWRAGPTPASTFRSVRSGFRAAGTSSTKLWNATRFALLNGATVPDGDLPAELSVPNRWILSRLAAVHTEVDGLYEEYEFAKVCAGLFHFAWDELFDWYIECAKVPLREGGTAAERTRLVLGHCFDTLLRLLHPLMPFVTDALWRALTGAETLVTTGWPTSAGETDPAAEEEMRRVQDLVTEIRRFRAQHGLQTGRLVPATVTGDLTPWAPHIGALAQLTVTPADAMPAGRAVLTASGARVGLDLSGAVDAQT